MKKALIITFITISLLSYKVARADIYSNLIGWWNFDSNSILNGVIQDTSKNGYNLNAFNISTSTFYTYGKMGQGTLFNGIDQYLENNSQIVSSYPFTMSAWVKTVAPLDANPHMIFTMAPSTSDVIFYGIGMTSNGLARCVARNTSTVSTVSTLDYDDSQWHLITCVFASNTSRILYVDGQRVGSSGVNVTLSASNNRFGVGRWEDQSPDSYFEGYIDDVRMYTSALSSNEVNQLYINGLWQYHSAF
jgi:hypothetical protein